MAKVSKSAAPAAPSRPYLKRVHLRNQPPLRDVRVDFKPGLNIIIGKNGSGKTNFMKLVSELADLYGRKYRGAGCELVIGGREEVGVRFHEQTPASKSKRNISSLLTGQQPLLTVVTSAALKNQDEILLTALPKSMQELGYVVRPVWHGMPAYRLPIMDEGADLKLAKDGHLLLTNSDVEIWAIESHLVQACLGTIVINSDDKMLLAGTSEELEYFIGRTIDIHLERLASYLPAYSPILAVRRSEQFQVHRNTAEGYLLFSGLVLSYKIGDDWLPFSALSDGTKRIFYLIGELLSASFAFIYADRETEFHDDHKIILLEEPELGIHPQQLQLLLQLIREVSREHQVIMTTHSPQVLDMLNGQELDRITICEYVPGKGTQMRKLSAAKKAKAKAYLQDQGFLSEFWRFSNLEAAD